jgi:Brp/Blh family beta-carotene 15,15'-monooxygenase
LAEIHAIPTWLSALPFALSLIAFGMPHGAADGVIAWRYAEQTCRPMRSLAVVLGVYSSLIAAFVALLLLSPAAALSVFIAFSVLHFGFAASRLYVWDDRITGTLLAGAVVLLPFAIHPEATREVFANASHLVGGDGFGQHFVDGFAAAAVVCSGSLLLVCLARALRLNRIAARAVLMPLALLTLAFMSHLVLPPLMAVGLWFLAWHAIPETIAVGRLDGSAASGIVAASRAHVMSLPLLLPTLAALAIASTATDAHDSVRGIAILALVAYAAVTPAHAIFQETIRVRVDSGAAA